MPDETPVLATHPRSGRTAIVADEGESVWLYLSAPGGREIVADCWLANRVPAPPPEAVRARASEYRARGEPPPAPATVVTENAPLAVPLTPENVRLAWTADGESVAAWMDGALAGFIVGGERPGYSARLRTGCPWGQPLDRALHDRLFGAGDV